MDVIRSVIMRVRKRLCLIRVVSGGFGGMLWGIAFSALLLLAAFVFPLYGIEVAAAAAVVCGGLAGLVSGFVKRPNACQTAMQIDRAGYQERFLTAWENREKEDAFSDMQRRDTERFAKEINAITLVPYRIAWRKLGILGLGIMVLLVLAVIPAPMKEQAEKRHEIVAEARAEIQKLEQTKEAVKALKDLKKKQTEALIRDLEQAKQELRAAKGKKELDKAKERLAKKLQMMARDQKKKTVQDRLLSMAEAYQSPEQKKELLAKEEASKNQEDSSQEQTGKDPTDTGNFGAKGDQNSDQSGKNGENPSDGSSNAAGKSSGSGSDRGAKAEEGQAGKPGTKSSGQSGSQDGSGQGSNGSLGSQSQNAGGSGENPAGSGSQGGNGSGSGSGSQQGNGSGSGAGGNGWNYGSKDKNEQKGSAGNKGQMVAIAAPTQDSKNLTGQKNEKGASEQIRSEEVQEWAGDPVAYDEVIADYTNQAYSDINQKQYPDELANVVKQYFEELNQ